MKLRHIFAVILVLIAQSANASQIITVTKFQYGKQWAFTIEELQLLCRPDQSLFALNINTLVQYPLNEKAVNEMTTGQVKATPVERILLDDPAHPGQKMSIAPFTDRAQQLCNQPQ